MSKQKYIVTIETKIVDEYEVEAENRADAEVFAWVKHEDSATRKLYYEHYDICERDKMRIETVNAAQRTDATPRDGAEAVTP